MAEHNLKGNCVSSEAYRLTDGACYDHDELRGECSVCPECPECEKEEE